ncbi:MAG: epoxyqueuosine reductase, partial [Pseudomonadota bacterium]|nr:epoxyqueuosine reductase [Pseudomonadota bacterium]
MTEGRGLKEAVVARAREEGFSLCRVCRPGDIPQAAERLLAFLEAWYHGQMGLMAERSAWRCDKAALLHDARSVIMMAENYT